MLLPRDLSALYTHCKVMKFLFPSLVSLVLCLKLLKTREVIIAGYENSSRLHSSDGLGRQTWRIFLINSCSAKGRWYWGSKQVRARDMRSGCRQVRRKTLYTDRTEQQEAEDEHDSPFENSLLTREEGKEPPLIRPPSLQPSLLIHSVLHMPLERLKVKHLGGA